MTETLSQFFKGIAIGAANVIPGVSGGTIALLTGVYERLLSAISGFGGDAVRLLLGRQFKPFWRKIDGSFLAAVGLGAGAGLLIVAKLLKVLLQDHQIPTMAFFFGLILLSVWFVGRTVRQWRVLYVVAMALGVAIAVGVALLAPATENPSPVYIFVCGVVAISSMVLPGLSGSFVLIMMGNYALVLGAVSNFNMSILLPMALGCIVGLLGFAKLLTWVFRRYHDGTIALMTGFVLGSLVVIWPWKNTRTAIVERVGKPAKEIVTGFDWYLPTLADEQTGLAIAMVVAGAATIYLTEKIAGQKA